ncbi:ABC transporter permease [Pseudarthrobacter sp. BRE9]|uniref:ABC transporter permease n=1 Tax=Pseudarthrobacter sp. BRE9 TaxID=2962582 RepID=UPI002882573B|nr:ABC transporter permease [Pseudarthrobacter sp. BRE9]MDT0170320.1 ABC transporter permease [Pseudarthrobacter sp. BRE9]
MSAMATESTSSPEPAASAGGRNIRHGAPSLAGPTFLRVLNSEVIKFRSLLSTLILLASTVVVMVGFGALSAWGTGQFADAATRDPQAAARMASQGGDLAVSVPTSGIAFAQLILGSLGVLLMSSEFTTGMARSTFAAVPRRLPAFAAKLVVVMVTSFVVTAVSTWVAGLAAVPILDNYGLKLDTGSSQSVKLLLVNSIYVAAVAAIGMALGTLIRNSAGGIMSLVGIFFVAPIAFQLIPGDFFEEARKYLPGNTVEPLTAAQHVPDTLEAWQAALVLGAWVVIPVLLAAVLLRRRDV